MEIMKNAEENKNDPKDCEGLLEEYKLLREDKNHHDTLIWYILYFYFAIAPLFLLVGGELEDNHTGALSFYNF